MSLSPAVTLMDTPHTDAPHAAAICCTYWFVLIDRNETQASIKANSSNAAVTPQAEVQGVEPSLGSCQRRLLPALSHVIKASGRKKEEGGPL